MKSVGKIFLLVCLLLNTNLQAQEVKLQGIVVDAVSQQPLKGADVYLSKTSIGSVTDEDGYFLITSRKFEDKDSLIINFLGYKSYRMAIKSFKNNSKILLEPASLDYGDEIIIRGERENLLRQDIPQSRIKIDYREIEQFGSSEITDILKPAPAIRIEGNDLDGRRIQIRGSNADEVNVYLDGVLINNLRFDNSADLSIIPVENIEEMEIVKSGNSTLLGNGAFAGVVNISSRKPDHAGAFIKAKVGSFENRQLLGNVNLFFSKRLNFSYFGQVNRFSPEIEYYQDERFASKTRSTDIITDKQNHTATMNYFTKSGQYMGRMMMYLLDYEKPGFQNNYLNFLTIFGYDGNIFGSPNYKFVANHFYSENNIIRNLPEQTVEFSNKYISNRINIKLAKKFQYELTEIQLLTEYLHDDLKNIARVRDQNIEDQRADESFYDNKLSLASVFSFSDKLEKWPQLSWKTYIGLRGDVVASGHSDVSPSVGAQLEFRTHPWEITPYVNFGKNVNYPTLLENAYVRGIYNVSLTDTLSDRLKPEYSNSAEFGINFKYLISENFMDNLELTYELFNRTSYNKLITRPFDYDLYYIQIGRNVTKGYEISFKMNELWRRFLLTVSWIELNISDPFLYAYKPESNQSINLQYHSGFGLYINSSFFHEGKSVGWYLEDASDDLIIQEISPFYDMDIIVGFRIPLQFFTTEIQFAGYNIFDNSGYDYYYLKKRNLQFSLAIKY